MRDDDSGTRARVALLQERFGQAAFGLTPPTSAADGTGTVRVTMDASARVTDVVSSVPGDRLTASELATRLREAIASAELARYEHLARLHGREDEARDLGEDIAAGRFDISMAPPPPVTRDQARARRTSGGRPRRSASGSRSDRAEGASADGMVTVVVADPSAVLDVRVSEGLLREASAERVSAAVRQAFEQAFRRLDHI